MIFPCYSQTLPQNKQLKNCSYLLFQSWPPNSKVGWFMLVLTNSALSSLGQEGLLAHLHWSSPQWNCSWHWRVNVVAPAEVYHVAETVLRCVKGRGGFEVRWLTFSEQYLLDMQIDPISPKILSLPCSKKRSFLGNFVSATTCNLLAGRPLIRTMWIIPPCWWCDTNDGIAMLSFLTTRAALWKLLNLDVPPGMHVSHLMKKFHPRKLKTVIFVGYKIIFVSFIVIGTHHRCPGPCHYACQTCAYIWIV